MKCYTMNTLHIVTRASSVSGQITTLHAIALLWRRKRRETKQQKQDSLIFRIKFKMIYYMALLQYNERSLPKNSTRNKLKMEKRENYLYVSQLAYKSMRKVYHGIYVVKIFEICDCIESVSVY